MTTWHVHRIPLNVLQYLQGIIRRRLGRLASWIWSTAFFCRSLTFSRHSHNPTTRLRPITDLSQPPSFGGISTGTCLKYVQGTFSFIACVSSTLDTRQTNLNLHKTHDKRLCTRFVRPQACCTYDTNILKSNWQVNASKITSVLAAYMLFYHAWRMLVIFADMWHQSVDHDYLKSLDIISTEPNFTYIVTSSRFYLISLIVNFIILV